MITELCWPTSSDNLGISVDDKQDLLETFETAERMDKVVAMLNKEIQVLELSNKIQSEVKGEMDKAQREYFLREQLKAIQKELGESDDRQDEFDELKKKIKAAHMPKDVEKVAFKELKRMSRMSPGARSTRSAGLHRLVGRTSLGNIYG